MRIGVPKEIEEGEKRVALTPEVATQLQKLGFTLAIETQAGVAANFSDEEYRKVGVEIVEDPRDIWRESDIILHIRPPKEHPELGFFGVELMKPGQTLISFLYPAMNPELLQELANHGITALAMDSVPRISRAQKMDALSSMANIAGYRAVVEAAQHFGRFFTGQITAAGKIPPAKVLVIGAGVAGLAAIGAAKSMGAIVRAFDTRPEVKEQVESMDAEFLMLDFPEDESGSGQGGYAKTMSPEFIKAEMDLFASQAAEVDIIITTALIPGKPAPELITERMVANMKPGSVIVDLAAEAGGNCKLTEANKVVVKHGVTLIGYTNLPSRLAAQSSQLYATNLRHLLTDLCPEKNGEIVVNMEDEVIRGATVVKEGKITWPPPAPRISLAPKEDVGIKAKAQLEKPEAKPAHPLAFLVPLALAGLALFGLGSVAPPEFIGHLTVFVLSCFIGYMVIWGVSHSLHTPLMSVTNAISSIIVIGALIQISSDSPLVVILATLAVFITSINIVGGFAVTQRMLRMFRK
ncbi:Re/Si-specific NAD(P)(+) transhydrogenase subunit alpha [Marinobacterium sp. D7]|uniref:Re/Si-specific NAD(P)(+) transhydrogenase subunit alpha n=1 Tax=Marinobacterium ramblicola TaxID=2849041 RepID=UPI001C2CD348|nr:Re/Si-specific NAD(P)(+) transhydrogenase subunit alpha [Marinobacterium ramblicola]MBV1790556.1 Re/Si-specific NAD(P)(+) transhydrogenase subunit alpha [Marinobacterium ramblicola]